MFYIVSGAFNGEKVMFDLPSGIKAEEVAWISVWCRAYRSIICICGQGQRVNMYLFYLKWLTHNNFGGVEDRNTRNFSFKICILRTLVLGLFPARIYFQRPLEQQSLSIINIFFKYLQYISGNLMIPYISARTLARRISQKKHYRSIVKNRIPKNAFFWGGKQKKRRNRVRCLTTWA